MDDEEFYHLMTADLERLHRVHHHVEPPPTATTTRRSSLPAALAAAAFPPVIWMSHLTGELKEAVHHGVEMVAAKWNVDVWRRREEIPGWMAASCFPAPTPMRGRRDDWAESRKRGRGEGRLP
ncbi:hypothetical protein B0T18DRAFT_395151 [Schizothecium vesticola]|uniref:Uncharacterized protein n=1 Tax=Schizothecium vesticola TaxID=314040 RepID=A0AA40BR80_9PEZI|nr:hypothetical protein B0T18DRAFT_395151 [Schizothecium vesticola]